MKKKKKITIADVEKFYNTYTECVSVFDNRAEQIYTTLCFHVSLDIIKFALDSLVKQDSEGYSDQKELLDWFDFNKREQKYADKMYEKVCKRVQNCIESGKRCCDDFETTLTCPKSRNVRIYLGYKKLTVDDLEGVLYMKKELILESMKILIKNNKDDK